MFVTQVPEPNLLSPRVGATALAIDDADDSDSDSARCALREFATVDVDTADTAARSLQTRPHDGFFFPPFAVDYTLAASRASSRYHARTVFRTTTCTKMAGQIGNFERRHFVERQI